MKKVMILLMALVMIIPAYSENKALEKARQKELKEKLKEYKKGKWEIMGSHTMEVSLAMHYDRLNQLGEDAEEIVGISTATKSKNTGKQMALNNAAILYAQDAGSTLKGRVVSDMYANGADATGEFEKFYAAYERLVEKEIKGELDHSYTIIRPNSDGTYEIQSYFIVSESKAAKARQRALEDALKESQMAQDQAEQISSFVREGF